jgi:thymidylate kinase
MIRSALNSLADAGIPYALRGEQPIDDLPPGGDVDVLVNSADLARAHRCLFAAGFHRLEAPGSRGHRFYLAFEHGRWLKLDVNVVPSGLGWELSATDEKRRALFAGYRVGPKAGHRAGDRLRGALDHRRPASVRRLGPVVAILGPDGAGKGSVIAALRAQIPVAVAALYLGDGGSSRSEYEGGARSSAKHVHSVGSGLRAVVRNGLQRLPDPIHEVQSVLRRTAAGCLRLLPAYARAWRGDIVLCDRHPIEALAVGAYRPGRVTRLESWMIERVLPRPDAILILDAPGDVLFSRKGEHSPDALERWRRGYLEAFRGRAVIVPTEGGLEATVARASAVVWDALHARRGW